MEFGSISFGAAQSTSVAVDNTDDASAGDFYVRDMGISGFPGIPRRIFRFESEGNEFGAPWPLKGGNPPLSLNITALAVDSSGEIWVSDRELVDVFSPSGAVARPPVDISAQCEFSNRIAFDSADNLYMSCIESTSAPLPEIFKYTAASNYTAVSEVDPGNTEPVYGMAIDTVKDRLFVTHNDEVVEYDVGGGEAKEVSGFGAGLGGVFGDGLRGIAVDEANQLIYVSHPGQAQIHVFGTETDEPLVTTLAASDLTAASATANGTVNPRGFALSDCSFQYVAQAAFEKSGFADLSSGGSVPCGTSDGNPIAGPGEIPADTSDHSVGAELSGLDPATPYRYRLSATNPEGTADAQSQPFATLGPLISQTKVSGVAYSAANLSARINPQGQATTYRFEFVTAAKCEEDEAANGAGHCFDSATSTPERNLLGEDHAEHIASAALTGLAEDTAYLLRVVAANADVPAGALGATLSFATYARPEPPDESCPNAAHRGGPSASLPECRAYEQVSPIEKGSADAAETKAQAASSGDALVFRAQALQAFPGSLGSANANHYLARRNPDGSWSGENLTTALAPGIFNGSKFNYLGFSNDLSKAAFCSNASLGVPGDGAGLYTRENLGGTHVEVPGTTSFAGGKGTCEEIFNGEGFLASPDHDRIFFESDDQLTPDAPDLGGPPLLYAWDGNEVTLVSRDEGGTPITGTIFPYRDHAVSVDGGRLFWSSSVDPNHPASLGTLYAHTEGEEATIDVGASERSVPDPSGKQGKVFVEASADGETVFFVSGEKLTDDSTATPQLATFVPVGAGGSAKESGELYRYDFSQPEGERLTDITIAPGEPKGAQVQGVIDASDDGKRIYFLALGDLAPGAVSGQPNLYLWDASGVEPTTTHIATLAPSSQIDKDNLFPYHSQATPMASPDGERLLFLSVARLTEYDSQNRAMLYLYHAPSDELTCLSCDPSGEPASASAELGVGAQQGITANLMGHQRRNISADGTRVFFETADGLLPTDTNGRIDVYEWTEGELHLISTGQSGADSHFVDASLSGADVFITTRSRLSPLDADSQVDVYDARVGGITPPPPPPPPICQGETCQPRALAPNDSTPASSGFQGPGNPSTAPRKPRKRCAKGKRRVRRAGKARCVRRQQKKHRHRANAKRRNHR